LSNRHFAAIDHYQVFSSYSQQHPSMMWSRGADIRNAIFALASYCTFVGLLVLLAFTAQLFVPVSGVLESLVPDKATGIPSMEHYQG
jgi:hypothetical protein